MSLWDIAPIAGNLGFQGFNDIILLFENENY